MTIEEKAKAYDAVIRRAKLTLCCCNSASIITKKTVYDIIPELKETENEEIRKGIISGMKILKEQGKYTFGNIPIDNIVTWLEKQKTKIELYYPLAGSEIKDAIIKCIDKAKREGDIIIEFNGWFKLVKSNSIVEVLLADYERYIKYNNYEN